eukprot:scaffold107091_cov15-Tisochrysis_lutea.AAC.1
MARVVAQSAAAPQEQDRECVCVCQVDATVHIWYCMHAYTTHWRRRHVRKFSHRVMHLHMVHEHVGFAYAWGASPIRRSLVKGYAQCT